MDLNRLSAYELVKEKDVTDLYSAGYLLKHKKSGARIFVLENDDENKVFAIGFRTPPLDSTGAPHIMEHSVLCGSKKFPAKDPFVELVKGSLNTFLNAMTYPDKTVYPIASCNDKDFKNLMHVYMDAVFYPNIYDRPQIFKQEGWHYELFSKDDPITINGVVYNEMKGAFSSAEDMVDRKIYEALYPDTAYALESGGDPEVIPELTYERFKEFHQKYYHPSNSYIYLYGNADMVERLNWLDEEYLCKYDVLKVDSELKLQEAFDKCKEIEFEYPITEEEDIEDNTYLSYSCVIDTALNKELYLAFQIIEYALLAAPGAPLKEALIKNRIGKDVISSYENGIYQPYFSIMVKNANKEDKDRFVACIRDTLSSIVKEGIDKKALEAGINYYEFKYREADFGSYPKGLMYGLQSFDSWLYDDAEPFMHIEATGTIDFLKEKVGTGYFEELIDRYLINNNHCALIVSVPDKGLTAKKDEALARKLSDYKEKLSDKELEILIEDTKALKQYQEEPSTKEELLSIPLLEISDIRKDVKPIDNQEIKEDGITYLYHDIPSNGIGYLTLLFDLSTLPKELIPYAGIVKSIIGLVSTENYGYADLTNEINRQCGGITTGISCHDISDEPDDYMAAFEIEAKMLSGKEAFVFAMIEELIFKSRFDEHERIQELLMMFKSRMQMTLQSSGHSVASLRARSYFSQTAAFTDIVSGYEAYKFVSDILDNYESVKGDFADRLKETLSYILDRNALLIDYTGSKESFDEIRRLSAGLVDKLSDIKNREKRADFLLTKKNEGFKSSGQVQYVAIAGNYKKANLPYTGALRVLRVILGYDYLWNNVRVKGGAYGCMNGFLKNGDAYLVSYRDPNLSKTIDIFKNTAEYIKSFDPDDRDMTKYIIGTISDIDIPLTPKMRGERSLSIYLRKSTIEELQKSRDEILSADKEAIRALYKYAEAIINQYNLCVIGGEEKVKEEKELFNSVENLF